MYPLTINYSHYQMLKWLAVFHLAGRDDEMVSDALQHYGTLYTVSGNTILTLHHVYNSHG